MQKVLENLRGNGSKPKPKEDSDIISRAKAAWNQYLKQMEKSNMLTAHSTQKIDSEVIFDLEETKQKDHVEVDGK